MHLTLRIWRQRGPEDRGAMVTYDMPDVNPDMSFLEMLDVLNERLILDGQEPVSFDHDCREGICGACGMVINGQAHGPRDRTTTCQLHMREFSDGDTIVIEPWRSICSSSARCRIFSRPDSRRSTAGESNAAMGVDGAAGNGKRRVAGGPRRP